MSDIYDSNRERTTRPTRAGGNVERKTGKEIAEETVAESLRRSNEGRGLPSDASAQDLVDDIMREYNIKLHEKFPELENGGNPNSSLPNKGGQIER
ncbi:MAG: hypothetical protein R3D71_05310 [Rickettsiales bacterium]